MNQEVENISVKIKYDTTAKEVAELFNCTDSYVRKVVADREAKKYKGAKPRLIRTSYWRLKNGKSKLLQKENLLLQSVKKLIPFQKAS